MQFDEGTEAQNIHLTGDEARSAPGASLLGTALVDEQLSLEALSCGADRLRWTSTRKLEEGWTHQRARLTCGTRLARYVHVRPLEKEWNYCPSAPCRSSALHL